ncbi:MAG: hypothetical protein AAFR21_11410 [Pseudomonadota bacterium]
MKKLLCASAVALFATVAVAQDSESIRIRGSVPEISRVSLGGDVANLPSIQTQVSDLIGFTVHDNREGGYQVRIFQSDTTDDENFQLEPENTGDPVPFGLDIDPIDQVAGPDNPDDACDDGLIGQADLFRTEAFSFPVISVDPCAYDLDIQLSDAGSENRVAGNYVATIVVQIED